MLSDKQAEQSANIPIVDMIYFAKLSEKRDRKGADWCQKKGMGRDRAVLERRWPTKVSPILKGPMDGELVHSADEARRKLARFCSECRRCRLAQE